MNQLVRIDNTTRGNKLPRDKPVAGLFVDESAMVFPALRVLLGGPFSFGLAGDAVWGYAVCRDAGVGGGFWRRS